MYTAYAKRTVQTICLKSFEIELGASQAATQGGIHERCHEALSEDGKMILLIN